MTYSQHPFTETKCISEMKQFFFSPPEALDRVGNKTSITFYFSEWWLQQREAVIFSPHCSGWRLCGNHPPEWSQNKALLQKQSPFDSCTDFIQSLLCPCSFTIVTCSLSENSLCPPYLWSCPAQFLTKSQLGRPPAADLVKQDFSVNRHGPFCGAHQWKIFMDHSGAHQWKIFTVTFRSDACLWDSWDLGPFAVGLTTWTKVSSSHNIQRNYKGLKITVCMHS